jgi:hypothetical protein
MAQRLRLSLSVRPYVKYVTRSKTTMLRNNRNRFVSIRSIFDYITRALAATAIFVCITSTVPYDIILSATSKLVIFFVQPSNSSTIASSRLMSAKRGMYTHITIAE